MKKVIPMLLLFLGVFMLKSVNANAANTVTVKQINDTEESVTLSCYVQSDYYDICTMNFYTYDTPRKLVATDVFVVPNAEVEKTVSGLPSGSVLQCSIGFSKTVNEQPVWVNAIDVVTSIDDFEGTLWEEEAGDDYVVVKTNPIPNATHYLFTLLDESGNEVAHKQSKDTECKFTNLSQTKKYSVTMQPVIVHNGYTTISDFYIQIEIVCKPVSPSSIICESIDSDTSKGVFRIKGNDADYYEVTVESWKGKKVAVYKTLDKEFEVVDSALYKDRFMRVSAKACITVKDKVIKSAKSKYYYFTALHTASAKRINENKVKISWDKISGADYYNVYFYRTGSSEVKVASKVTDTSVKVKFKTSPGKYYTIKVVPVRIVDGTAYKSVKDTKNNYSYQVIF